ncbi:MAG TPA: aminoglycoside phosphotransferase family protein [Streptosporangiaceae bacterium]|nr:aminoglycoside phosphotransferase family protein [Streptosporangiaceae bacterium]
MRDLPEGITERDVARALADGWDLAAWTLEYAPVGGGSYHWVAAGGAAGERRFVTVDDLDDKGWLGRTRPAVLAGLRAAMDAATTLRRRAGLGFVVAPEPASTGDTVRPVGDRHAVAVFPFLTGTPGDWDEPLPAPERDELIAMLAALHGADPGAVRLPRFEAGLSWRGDLETALRELGRPWGGGPYAEPARELLAGTARTVRRQLETLDRGATRLAAAEVVITHGEPHPGNVIHGADGLLLIDWDTVGLAPPERDLWSVATESGDEVRRYTELTGRRVDPAVLEFYRLRWALDDLSCFVRDLRAPHRRTPGTEHAWQALEITLADLTALAR